MDQIQAGLRGVIRLTYFILIIAAFLVWSFACHWVIRDPDKRKARFSKNAHFFCRYIVKIFGVNLNIIGKPQDDEKFLLVSNHMGFVDILMLCSVSPTVFVTSREMRETPFLGLLTEMAGCIYVERRNRAQILEEMKSMARVLEKGHRVVLYPEATSTNGEQVLPFKRSLMMAAPHAGVPIQPAVINFRKVNGEEFTTKWRDHLCWYGDITFAASLWRAFTLKCVDAEIEFLEKVHATREDDRGLLAEKLHGMISSKFVPVKAWSESEPLGALEPS